MPITVDLATGAHVAPADLFEAGTPWADTLASHYEFLRAIEQTLRLLEETHEPLLQVGTRRLALVARRLVRERDGHDPARVLCATYARRAAEVREIFERVAAPVHTRGAPWQSA